MKIKIIASTKENYTATKNDFDMFSGKNAGVCYLSKTFDDLINEAPEKTQKRIEQTKINGHHSVYDHNSVSLYLEDIPKALALVINNEKMYTTSEKSARYTKMVIDEDANSLYTKWMEIFKEEISNKYALKYPEFFTPNKITKLAQENARYLISVFTPTSLVYTTTYRQLNYLYSFMQNEINNDNSNKFYKMLKPAMIDFCKAIKNMPYYDENLTRNEKTRELSLFAKSPVKEYFGDVYATSYLGAFAQLGQAQRHRTLSYNIELLNIPTYYVPPIIKSNNNLIEEWQNDCLSQTKTFPQGMLVNINEMGTLDNFVLKMMERKCTYAQLEINNQTTETLNKYIHNLELENHPRLEELKAYNKGARCTFPNYTCNSPCHFKEGITEERLI